MARQEAGAPASVVQANARQYRDAPALALVFSGPLAPKANWQSWLSVSEGAKQVRGVDPRRRWPHPLFPERATRQTLRGEPLKAGLGPSPALDPQDPAAGGGPPLPRAAWYCRCATSCACPSARSMWTRSISTSSGSMRVSARFLAEYRPGAGMGNWELEQITKRAKRVFSGRYALEARCQPARDPPHQCEGAAAGGGRRLLCGDVAPWQLRLAQGRPPTLR